MLNKDQKYTLMQRRGWNCGRCGKRVTTATGEVHHTNRNPDDDRAQNLRVLCRSCHQDITARFR